MYIYIYIYIYICRANPSPTFSQVVDWMHAIYWMCTMVCIYLFIGVYAYT